jgi:hypothetical protein
MKIPANPAPGTLIVYSRNGSTGFYGLVFKKEFASQVMVFDLESKKTFPISSVALWLPFTLDNHRAMCAKGWWRGMTFDFVDEGINLNEARTVLTGTVVENKKITLYVLRGSYGLETTLEKIILTGHLKAN